MRSMNEAMLIGHVGGDPECRTLQSGDEVANFTLATNERYTDAKGEERESTEWHRIVAFKGRARVIRDYVRKGQPLLVRGKIRTRQWEDQEGARRVSREIVLAGPSAVLNLLPSGSAMEPEEGGEEPAAEEEAA
ncbi:MAG: single-stranded DNA-binding protein [Defluviicoccus sp.]|nr:single-stranded DNA-binding protein [Defluviicoccus sp.]MDE0334475.1 single-stranded DNA-binding protein [Defluviicoccus sp.]